MRERDVRQLECVGGPANGRSVSLGAPATIERDGHRYALTKDDTGALFYEWRGVWAAVEVAA